MIATALIPSSLAEAALEYARCGWKIFPLQPGTKIPLSGTRGHLDATSDLCKVRDLWEKHPNANIGLHLAASGLVALDVDSYKPECEFEIVFADICMPPTLVQRSASGGRHYVFKATAGDSFPGNPCRGVEIKHKGYIVLEPSVFNGGQYYFEIVEEPAPAPDWLPRKGNTKVPENNVVQHPASLIINGIDLGPREDLEDDTNERLLRVLQTAPNNLDRADWVKLGHAVKSELGARGRTPFLAFSARYANCNNQEDARMWDTLTPNGDVGAGTAFELLGSDGRDRRRTLTTAPSVEVVKDYEATRDLGLIHFDEDLDPELDDTQLVEDLLPLEGFGALYGPPGCKKTFVALDLALTVAGGASNWNGKHVEQGAVLYFGMEGGRLFKNRVAAFAREKSRATHFYRSNANLDLRSTEIDAKAIIAEARKVETRGAPVRLVVIDTVSRALSGGKENAPEDMGAFVALCEEIRKELSCFFLVIHHSGKDQGAGLRGHTSLLGAIDTALELDGESISVVKQRDGQDGVRYGYRLRVIELGTSPRGKTITSGVIEFTEAGERKINLTPNQRNAREALQQYIADHGQPSSGGTGFPDACSVKYVELEAFSAFLSAKLTNTTAKERNRSARTNIKSLVDKGVAQCNEGFLWLL